MVRVVCLLGLEDVFGLVSVLFLHLAEPVLTELVQPGVLVSHILEQRVLHA